MKWLSSLCFLNTAFRYLFVAGLLSAFWSCNKKCKIDVDVSKVSVNLKTIRLEKTLFNLKSTREAKEFLQRYPDFSASYFEKDALKDSDQFSGFLYRYFSNKELRVLYRQTDSTFRNFIDLHNQLSNFYNHVKYYFPSATVPVVYTLVSGFQFQKDILISDSLVVLSLDYFIGPNAKYRPPFYNYFLERYRKEYIVPMVALGVSGKYNALDVADETMLANMIYYGKAYFFAEKTMPCAPDSLIAQYSSIQIKGIQENINTIWGHFIEKKLLFDSKPTMIEKYVGESPRINEIGADCPGRIGRWLGWQIVKKYHEVYPNLSLQQIMAEKDAQKIFRLSKYKPEKP